jgi:hypothetical protein
MNAENIVNEIMLNANIFVDHLRLFIKDKNDENVKFEVSATTFSVFQTTDSSKKALKKDDNIYYLIYFFYYGNILNIYIYHNGFKYCNDRTPDKLSELIVVIDDKIQLCLDSISLTE